MRLTNTNNSVKEYNIKRENNSAQREFVISRDEVLKDIFVFDWEINGSIGTIPIQVNISTTFDSVTMITAGIGTGMLYRSCNMQYSM